MDLNYLVLKDNNSTHTSWFNVALNRWNLCCFSENSFESCCLQQRWETSKKIDELELEQRVLRQPLHKPLSTVDCTDKWNTHINKGNKKCFFARCALDELMYWPLTISNFIWESGVEMTQVNKVIWLQATNKLLKIKWKCEFFIQVCWYQFKFPAILIII